MTIVLPPSLAFVITVFILAGMTVSTVELAQVLAHPHARQYLDMRRDLRQRQRIERAFLAQKHGMSVSMRDYRLVFTSAALHLLLLGALLFHR